MNDKNARQVAIGVEGWLFINGTFATTLDLRAVTGTGGVILAANIYGEDGREGAVTRYENFTVRSICCD